MTIHLNWPADVVNRLTEEARNKGLSLDSYLLETVLQRKSSTAPASDAGERRRQREEAAASVRELRKGNTLGPDVTIRELIKKGAGSEFLRLGQLCNRRLVF